MTEKKLSLKEEALKLKAELFDIIREQEGLNNLRLQKLQRLAQIENALNQIPKIEEGENDNCEDSQSREG